MSDSEYREIKIAPVSRGYEIARRYGVSPATISRVRKEGL
jgi:DNA-binding MurR/RpiR family transcriptional regulator